MTTSDTYDYEYLKKLFKTRTVGELVAVFENQDIKYLKDRKGRPICTQNALDHAMGLPISTNSISVNDEAPSVEAV